MTLNQIIKRLQTICLAHMQVRNFAFGQVQDFLNAHTTRYPSVFLWDEGGRISIAGKATTINFRVLFVDLVHVSEDAKANELDVQSDQLSVAMDIVTQMNNGGYNDWKVSTDNPVSLKYEENGDMFAGVEMNFSISIPFKQDSCFIPSDLGEFVSGASGDKTVYDLTHVADGGSTLSLPELEGKKILLVIREGNPIHKVNINPLSEEFTYSGTTMTLGAASNPGERFLILYRNY